MTIISKIRFCNQQFLLTDVGILGVVGVDGVDGVTGAEVKAFCGALGVLP